MVLVSAADSSMDDKELKAIGDIVRHLRAFDNFSEDELHQVAQACGSLLGDEDGFDTVLTIISKNLPDKLLETAYAIACDVAAANLIVEEDEMTVLQQLH